MFKVIKYLYKNDKRFFYGLNLIFILLIYSFLSFFSPYPPNVSYYTPINRPPSLQYIFGTNTRGQDLFWLTSFGIKNSLIFGIAVALISRIISILLGSIAGIKRGVIEQLLTTTTDTLIILPSLLVLIILKYLLKEQLNLFMLAFIMSILFGWAWDARLIRSQVMSLTEREFTYTANFSGMNTLDILFKLYFPYIIPIILSTTINNMIWSIGMETTLSILGLTDVEVPTLGTIIYWANQHDVMISGIWWWLIIPLVICVLLFIGLYLLVVSINDYSDPRIRIQITGGK